MRAYQATKFGISGRDGETCVIDLSALAAPNLKCARDREIFREHRISVIRQRIQQHRPTFVVTYGLMSKLHFERVAGGKFDVDGICESDGTVFMHTRAPTAVGSTNKQWLEFGLRLRNRCDRPHNEKKTHARLGS